MYDLSSFSRLVRTGGVEESVYQGIKPELNKSNLSIIRNFSLLAVIILFVLFLISLIIPSFSSYTLLYLVGLVVFLVILILAVGPGKSSNTVQTVDMYLFSGFLLAFGIILGTVLSPKEIAATFIAFLLTLPQLFTDRPYRMHLLIAVSVVVFIITAVCVKDPSTWNSDITNAVVFGILSIILSTYSIGNRISKYSLQEEIRYMAETDQLTGLKNRHCFQQSLKQAEAANADSLYCVYVDVNGLHELNDAKGHEAGDRMLRDVAAVMQQQFGEKDSYRIGGDEFVAFGTGRTAEEVESLVSALRGSVESAGYHVATGISTREKAGGEAEATVSAAEKSMYADKAHYYQTSGIERRRSRA